MGNLSRKSSHGHEARASLRIAAPADPSADALRALARVLLPYLQLELAAERDRDAFADVLLFAKTPKRATMAACRRGEIAGAVKRARRWIAPRESIERWLHAAGPRPLNDEDGLDDLRGRVARGSR